MSDIELWRRAALALDEWFCNGDAGRSKTDPVYQHVVQGRDNPKTYARYSSCADRAHARLWRLGVRSKFVNRAEQPGGWKPGVNISNLWNRGLGSPAITPTRTWSPEPADELLIWNSGVDAHSLSILSILSTDGTSARTANYGTAGMSTAVTPGARCSTGQLVLKPDGSWWYGRRKVQRVIKLADVIPLITAKPDFKDLNGEYIFGDGGTLDELEGIT